MTEALWGGAARSHSLGREQGFATLDRCSSGAAGLCRANSAVDMRQLTSALLDAREGTGEVRAVLLRAAFRPRLPGLTKMVSRLSKEGAWRKALEVFEAVGEMGLIADTALTNAAISACDKGGRWQKALEIFEGMEHQGLPRDAITYSAAISALAKGKQWHAAMLIFDHMQARPEEGACSWDPGLINALERGGQWQLAEKLFLSMCTVQDEVQDASTPQSLLAAAAHSPGGSKLLRAQTSPSSVLDVLQSPPGRGGGLPLMSIAESPRADGGWDGLSASLGILSATANARQDVLGGLPAGPLAAAPAGPATPQQQPQQLTAGEMEQLSSRFGGFALDGSAPGTTGAGGPDPASDPFAAASHLVSSVRGSSTASSRASLAGIREEEDAAPGLAPGFSPLRRASSGSVPPGAASPQRTASGGLMRSGSLKRELGIPQAEAAQSLRRAISCYPELAGAEGQPGGEGEGLASMFNFSHAARVTPNRVCCNALLAAYARAKPPQYQRALHLLSAMWDGGPTLAPDAVSYNTALKACANAFQVHKALDVYHEMVARRASVNAHPQLPVRAGLLAQGVHPSVTTFNCLLAAASDSGSYEALLEVGRALASADPDTKAACMNAYVAGLVKVGHGDEALAVFHDMLGPGSAARPTASTFNTIMALHIKAGQYEQVRAVFRDMLATGLTPSIVTYNTLLASYAHRGAWCEALEALAHVLASAGEGVNPNTGTYGSCLAAIAKAAGAMPPDQAAFAASKALQLFTQMRTTPGCTPDASTYASLVKILAAAQQNPQVVALHEVMLASGLTPDAPTASLVLSAALAAGQTRKALALANTLQVQGFQLDAAVLAHLVQECVGAEAWESALQLCNSAVVAQGSSCAPVFNFVLRKAAEARQFDAVVALLSAMRAANVEVDSGVAALPALSLEPAIGGAPAVFASLPGFAASKADRSPVGTPSLPPPPPSPSTPSAFAAAMPLGSPSPAPAFSLADANTLLEAMKARLDVAGGMEVLRNMKLAGLAPDEASYITLVELCVRASQPRLAVQLCAEGHEAGALHAYALPNPATQQQPGTALGNALDLRGYSLEAGAATLVTWLAAAQKMRGLGLVVRDARINIVLGPAPHPAAAATAGDQAGGASCAAALRDELVAVLTGRGSSLPAFQGPSPVQVEAEAVTTSTDDSTMHVLVNTAALYRALDHSA
ncbi:hypothetical protein COHA_005994 [Chlorella ohadii]|uniref:Uncharacterized protein n=1 Tax=Chlorella ohadii TaxID=2649997 RepID=A0AAD5DLK6_9CHLO|nr:hypothetical protein COHA_005994 [Chlorella ohadii]